MRQHSKRMSPGDFIRDYLLQKQDFKCVYCNIPIDGNSHEVDHKMPVSRGGTGDLKNLQATCQPCNRNKSNQTDAEFRESLSGKKGSDTRRERDMALKMKLAGMQFRAIGKELGVNEATARRWALSAAQEMGHAGIGGENRCPCPKCGIGAVNPNIDEPPEANIHEFHQASSINEEVLKRLIEDKKTYREVADELSISQKQVKDIVDNELLRAKQLEITA